MTPQRFWTGLRAAIFAVAPALIVALPPLAWVREGTYRASLTTLGRDQGIFQYIAWAVMHGDVDYRDVRDVNGPLIHGVHMFMLALGGRDEHRFRVLDLLFTGVAFAFVGACLPGVERSFRAAGRAAEAGARAGWAFAAWVVLSGQLLMYLYWDLAQRETFCHWFLLPSVGLQLLAQGKLASEDRTHARRWLGALVVSGALSVIPWFGKPTFGLFTIIQAFTLIIDRHLPVRPRKMLALFAAGGVLGALTQLAFLLRYGDIGAWLHITFHDVPAMYRFMMPRTPREILSLTWGGPPTALALAGACVMLGLILDGQLARRALVIALFPLCGVVSVIVQGKGFPYHFHPVTAGIALQWLLLVVWMWERFSARSRGTFLRFLPFAAAGALAARIAYLLPASPHLTDLWILDKGNTAEKRASHDYLVYFRDRDFFPWQMRQAAAYLREHTRPDDRVQLYGMDPYVLFLAERKSATPYIYAYDLNADAALAGSWMRRGLHPTAAQAAQIRSMRDAHEADMLARLEKSPPAAFVFIDGSPLLSYADSVYDFKEHNPDAAAWLDEHYEETAAFGEDRVWLRRDLAQK
ncbi:MAG TPA: hypothetical protein VGH28_20395 [Polyangiaceae bacterium]|jgi:hypothetical protein